MAYIKNNWVDREGTTRYFETVDDDGTLIFTPDYEKVTEIGTPVNADNMNHIEEGIEDHENRITVLEEAGDASNFLNKSQITNCLLEVPQRIKLELADGVLTLKAGSKVIVPNGVGVFDEVEVLNDLTLNQTYTGSLTVYVSSTASYISAFSGQNSSSDADIDTVGKVHYNTTTNKVTRINNAGKTEQLSFPIAIITMNASTVTSNDQVFNGFGYIGSTVWVDKGVKGLIPNGRNEDGTLNNIEYTTTKIVTRTFNSGSGYREVALTNQNALTIWNYYTVSNDGYLMGNGMTRIIGISVFSYTATNGVISNFQPKLPFRAVDYNDRNLPQVDGQWVRKFASLLVNGTASGGLNISEGAYSASFDLSNYLPNDKNDYMVTVRIFSQNGTVTNAYNNFCVDGGYGMMSIGKVSGKSVYQDSTIIIPIDSKHTLYIENAPSLGTSIGVNIQLENYRRVGNNN